MGDAGGRTSRPLPRGVERVLAFVVPRDVVESVVGDLEETFAAHGRGRLRTLAVWWQAARIGLWFVWEGAVRERRLPPIADQAPARPGWLDPIRQDVIFAVRLLRRQPGFALVAVLTLALGIGANTATFSLVDAVLWRPLPFSDAGSVVSLAEQRPREGRLHGPVSPADFADWRRAATSFAEMTAYLDVARNLSGAGEPRRARATLVTDGFLRVLGLAPALGRDFGPEAAISGGREVLLSDGLFRRAFGADPSVVGRRVHVDGEPFEVVGVLPPAFWWPGDPELLAPLVLSEHDRALRGAHFLSVVARLRPGVSLAQARGELTVIGRRLSAEYPENAGHAPELRPVRAALVGDTRTALLVLLGAVAFVLLIACADVATLLLARAGGRRHELAVRAAIGAGRGRIVRQFLIESLVLSAIGGAAGLLVGAWSLAGLRALLPSRFEALPGIGAVGLDARMLAVAAATAFATGIVFGIAPAFVASDRWIGEGLAGDARGGAGRGDSARFRAILVVVELALSAVLLVGAVLMTLSLRHLLEVEPGFRPQQLVSAQISLPASRYGSHTQATAFYHSLFDRLQSTPGIVRAAATSALPFSGLDNRLDLHVERRPEPASEPPRIHPRLVSAGYFATMGIPLVRGRAFDAHDDGSVRPVVVINQAAVRRYWPGEDPLGRRLRLGALGDWMTIVGIVGDVRHGGLDARLEPEAFMPLAQGFDELGRALERGLTIVVRTRPEVASPGALLRSAVAAVDPQQPLGTVRPMEHLVAESVAPQRLNSVVLGAFALVAVVLTAAGLYGVLACLVGQRTREIGVRMALGASQRQVAWLVLGQAGVMMSSGIAVGLAIALALSRSLTSLLFGVSPVDPSVYVGVSVLLAGVGALAAAVPCVRASRVDPLTALRHD
jgi:putative ABC transport system permease protein